MNECKYMMNMTGMEEDFLLILMTCLRDKWIYTQQEFNESCLDTEPGKIITDFCKGKVDVFSRLIGKIENMKQLNQYIIDTPVFLDETEIKELLYVFHDLLDSKYNNITKKVFGKVILKLLSFYKDIKCSY